MRRRLPIALLALGLAGAAGASPAHAALTPIGPDLTQTGPSTVALSDPNDVIWWQGLSGITVPQQGEIRSIRIKGGTVQNAEQRAKAQAFDPNYDITHWLVLRPQSDGTLKVVGNSEDVRLPIVGMNGVTEDTITEIRQPKDDYRVCALPGDVISLASVGGYVPTNGPTGVPNQTPGFQEGLPYQTFTRSPTAVVEEFRGGGMIPTGTTVRGTPKPALQLNMQAILGTGDDARFTCRTDAEKAAPSGGGSTPADPKVLPAMATPLNKRRKLGKDRMVSVSLTCRPDGAPCAGTIELRVHKKRIALGKYAGLAPGATGTYAVKLTKKGVYYVNADSDRKMLTTVVATATGGRQAGGKMYILPNKAKKAKRKKR